MKRAFSIILIFLGIGSGHRSVACDICGCGGGNYYIGILPDFNSRIIGVRYRSNMLQTHLGAGGSVSYLTADETYRTAELWGGWNINPKIRIMAYLPVSFDSRVNATVNEAKNGLGDAAVQGFYRLVDNRHTIPGNKLMVQALWIGGGVKLPTGRYEPLPKDQQADNTNLFQLGTGSLDFMLTAMYDLRIQDAGINITGSYKLNTFNRYDYSYGNKFSGSAQLYYKIRIKDMVTISPNAGIQYEASGKDMNGTYAVDVSGGNILFGTAGIEAMYKRFSAGGNWQPPLSQNLAGGFVKAHSKMMLHFSVLF